MRWIKSGIIAFSLYSKIPMPQMEWTEENMRYSLCFFPIVGVAVGALVWLWQLASAALGFGDVLRSAVTVLLPILVTGGIHVDGLLDTADALASWQSKERRLEILSDSHVGAFAVITCCGYFLAAFGFWTEVPWEAVGVLSLGFVLSRGLSAFGIATFPCAKGSGLAAAFQSASAKKVSRFWVIVECIACIGTMLWIHPLLGGGAVVAALLTVVAYFFMAQRKFGGITGDLQGFFLEMVELVMLIVVVFLSALC